MRTGLSFAVHQLPYNEENRGRQEISEWMITEKTMSFLSLAELLTCTVEKISLHCWLLVRFVSVIYMEEIKSGVNFGL